MTERTGQCMCGAVRFTARDVPGEYGICHCEMCKRWTGAALAAVAVPVNSVTWQGEAHVKRCKARIGPNGPGASGAAAVYTTTSRPKDR